MRRDQSRALETGVPIYSDPVRDILDCTYGMTTLILTRLYEHGRPVPMTHRELAIRMVGVLGEYDTIYRPLVDTGDPARPFASSWQDLLQALEWPETPRWRPSGFVRAIHAQLAEATTLADELSLEADEIVVPDPLHATSLFLKQQGGDFTGTVIDASVRARLFDRLAIRNSIQLADRVGDTEIAYTLDLLREEDGWGAPVHRYTRLSKAVSSYLFAAGHAMHVIRRSALLDAISATDADFPDGASAPRWPQLEQLLSDSDLAAPPGLLETLNVSELSNRLRGLQIAIPGIGDVAAGGLQTSAAGGTVVRIVGHSGAGKTAFALSLALALSPLGTRTLYLSCEEASTDLSSRLQSLIPPEARGMENFDRAFSWFQAHHLPHSDPDGHLDELEGLLQEIGSANDAPPPILPGQTPLMVVVDGFHEMVGFPGTAGRVDNMRRFLGLVQVLRATGALVVLMSARLEGTGHSDPVDYEVDTVLELELRQPAKIDEPPMRRLNLVKTRRQFSHLGGHEVDIAPLSGFRIYPRLGSQIAGLSTLPVGQLETRYRYSAFDLVHGGWSGIAGSPEDDRAWWIVSRALLDDGRGSDDVAGYEPTERRVYETLRTEDVTPSRAAGLLEQLALLPPRNLKSSGRRATTDAEMLLPPEMLARMQDHLRLARRRGTPLPMLPPDLIEWPEVDIHPGARILLSGRGATGKLGLALKILTSPIVSSRGGDTRSTGWHRIRDDARVGKSRRKLLVVTFGRRSDDVDRILEDARGSHIPTIGRRRRGRASQLPAIEIRTISVEAAYASAERFLEGVVAELNGGRTQGEPYHAVVLDGLQNVATGHPRLADSPMLWPLLFGALKRYGVTTASTYSFPDFGTSVGGRALGTAGEERGSGIRNVLEGVLAATDYHIELTADERGRGSGPTRLRFVSAYDQMLPDQPITWDKRSLSLTL